MKKEITKEQFAKWSFEGDLSAGCYDDEDVPENWNDLCDEDKAVYLGEAEYYFSISKDEWPEDILERL